MSVKLTKKFWLTLVIFSLVGQVAWVVENMYFNVFIYKMFNASAADISLMVSASAAAATLTTWLIGALSDKVGKRKIFICGGYILWGISILAFSFVRMDILTPIAGSAAGAASLGVTLVIILDCVMTFFGSSANDAAFNAWLTDMGDDSSRGRIEGINSMMPLVAILVVFGGFMGLNQDLPETWVVIFSIIGGVVLIIGVLGFFLIEDRVVKTSETDSYWRNVLYSFRPSTVRSNRLLYLVTLAFAVFEISIQVYMPYLIIYYEKSLAMSNYVFVMAPAIILASVATGVFGRFYDMLGFQKSVYPTVYILMAGYILLFCFTSTALVFIGSLLMMTGYLTGQATFAAMIRSRIPEDKTGLFQGLRIFGQVFVPGIVGPWIGAAVLRNAETVTNSDGTVSFLPNRNIFLAAFLVAVLVLMILYFIFRMVRRSHHELLTADEKAGKTGWGDHPRPQMRRQSFYSLNGQWTLNGVAVNVPFPPESRLSGLGRSLGSHLVYEKTFTLSEGFTKDRVLLNFGAVDQVCDVSLNGVPAGHHEGGYLPFSFDITNSLKPGENKLRVSVTDKLSHIYPYGKQRKKRGGMWYTPVSGIWQSVWIETVASSYITGLKITPDLSGADIEISGGVGSFTVNAEGRHFEFSGSRGRVEIEDPELWTPENPRLYGLEITSGEDTVYSYFALREVGIADFDGVERITLNGKPIFLTGVLDQGYYADGIFLPATEAEYSRDILRMKNLGFNLLRKHIKVEPDIFYAECDRLGMLVIQDMVNSGHYSFIRDTALATIGLLHKGDKRPLGNRKRKEFFEEHSAAIISHLCNHPSVIGYTIFNEGWGQFESDRLYKKFKAIDSSRIYDSTSGWFEQEESDLASRHSYFAPLSLTGKETRPVFLSEFGGLTLEVGGHIFSKYASYGYGTEENPGALTDGIIASYERNVLPFISGGLCGSVYTQLSDVEDEINGLYTYDREVCKVDKERILELNERLKASL